MPRTMTGILFDDLTIPPRWLYQSENRTDSGEWFSSVAAQLITVSWIDGARTRSGHIVEKISHQNIIGRSGPIMTRSWTISDHEGEPLTGIVHYQYSGAVEELIAHTEERQP